MSLSSYKLTPQGYNWGIKQSGDVSAVTANPEGYGPMLYEKASLLLSDKFSGFFLVPEGSWNYNFAAVKWSQHMQYSLRLENPRSFYDATHRSQHFLAFADSHGGGGGGAAKRGPAAGEGLDGSAELEADMEDAFA